MSSDQVFFWGGFALLVVSQVFYVLAQRKLDEAKRICESAMAALRKP